MGVIFCSEQVILLIVLLFEGFSSFAWIVFIYWFQHSFFLINTSSLIVAARRYTIQYVFWLWMVLDSEEDMNMKQQRNQWVDNTAARPVLAFTTLKSPS